MTQPLLETRAVSKHFGALRATNDVTFCLEEGARHALIGPNGAGKTTFINLLTGVLKPSAGQVLLAESSAAASTKICDTLSAHGHKRTVAT